jgi:dTDP-4-dehydrorhamnose 3,5-epimerase
MSSKIEILPTPISGLFVLKRKVISDNRGFFYRLFCQEELKEAGLEKPLSQINFSHANEKYTTRGCHFQHPPYTETKIVTCVKGEIFDVAVDLRKGSPTFLQWYGINLSEENNLSLYIPDGFAHASQSLRDNSSLVYLHTEAYSAGNEGGLNALDPMVSIKWPHEPKNLSVRDAHFPLLTSTFSGIDINEM